MTVHKTPGVFFLVLATAVAPRALSQSRDTAVAPTVAGAGSISGVVTDETSQQPVHGAAVTLSPMDGPALKVTVTDAGGRFTFSGLANSRYYVVATKPSYVRAAYGAKRYDRPGTPVTIAGGQAISNLMLRMAKGAVITGRVSDESGQPTPGALVRVLQPRTQNGEQTLAPVALMGGTTTSVTDDRGAYRIFGLPAGDYIVSVSPRLSLAGEIRQTTPSDIESVQRAIQAATTPGGAPAPIPPPPPVTVNYATVFYPGVTASSSARAITLSAGEERSGIDLPLQLVRTARIDGVVITPQGIPPQSVQLTMIAGGEGLMPLQLNLNRVAPGADGTFSYVGVAPGQYTITARVTATGGSGADANFARVPAAGGMQRIEAPAGTPGPAFWGLADVSVNGENLSGITINLQPGLTLSGRVAADAVGVEPPDLTRARITLAPAGNGGLMIGVPAAQIDAAGHFSMSGVIPGRYRVNAALSSPEASWSAKSVLFKGRDVLDYPLDIAALDDLSNVAVTFTSQTQEVSGALQDASGRPAPDFTIVVFPADKALWSSTRRVRTARPGTDGHFTVTGLPAGEYRIAAVADLGPGDTSDPSFLSDLASASIAITLRDGEKKTQDLRITSGVEPPSRGPFTTGRR